MPISKRGLFELEHKKINDYSILEPSQSIYKITRGEIIKDSLIYHINSHGQNGEDFTFKKNIDEIRIVFMGGSHIFDQDFHHFKGGPFTELVMTKFSFIIPFFQNHSCHIFQLQFQPSNEDFLR